MKIGYARVSKSDGSQTLNLQVDELISSGVIEENIYHDHVSGGGKDRPGLNACLKALRSGDTLVVWKLDRLGRNLRHLVDIIYDLSQKGIGFKVLTGQGANIDTTSSSGKLIFGIFAALAEFERELIKERTIAGLKSARARGIKGGRKMKLSKSQVKYVQVSMQSGETNVSELCRELGISRQTLYRYVSPTGELRDFGKKILGLM